MLALLITVMLSPPAPASEYTIDGSVKSIKGDAVEIQRDNGKVTTVKVTRATMLKRDGKPCKFDVFKEGSVVRCVFNLDNNEAIALGVYVEIDRPKR